MMKNRWKFYFSEALINLHDFSNASPTYDGKPAVEFEYRNALINNFVPPT
jgi:hypothetical protein